LAKPDIVELHQQDIPSPGWRFHALQEGCRVGEIENH
jgi:hypothetical protein